MNNTKKEYKVEGSNKLERQKNWLLKYLGISVSNKSNQYFKIMDAIKYSEQVISLDFRYVQKFESWRVNVSSDEGAKAIWVKPALAVELYNEKGEICGLLFNFWEGHKELIDKTLNSCDNTFLKKVDMTILDYFIRKN